MSVRNPRIDAYILKSAEFAIPILDYWRETVHAACPEVKETIKWSMPFFEYNNYNLCSMASFKRHCGFHFWLGSKLNDPDNIFKREEEGGMGLFGKVAKMEDLPDEKYIIDFIRQAMVLIDQGVRITKEPGGKAAKPLVMPDYFLEALEDNPEAKDRFERFSQSQKKEYVDWIAEAKSEATRIKRLNQAMEWMEEGKPRHWKYVR